MRVGVLGNSKDRTGAEYTNYDFIDTVLTDLASVYKFTEVVSGGGKGTETSVAQWCVNHNCLYTKIAPALRGSLPIEDAFMDRNRRIIDEVDLLVWFWNGTSAEFVVNAAGKATLKGIRTIIIPLP